MGPDLSARAMDPNGNTSAIWSLGGVAGFGYDDRNRLALVQQNLKTVMRYVLNGRGERVRKELAGKPALGRDFIYDESGRLLAEYTDRNGGGKDYLWADDTLIAMYASSGKAGAAQLQYIYTDGLGTPRAVTGSGGKVTLWSWPARQNPFGERAAMGTPDALNLRFPGQYFDEETGLHYNYFRDYEPGVGRYVQSDPLGIAVGASTYGYVGSAPLTRKDPRGLQILANSPVTPGHAPTIQCDGRGGVSIFYGHQYRPSQMECFGDCITQQESNHAQEYVFAGPDVCAGKPAGLQVYSPSQLFSEESEVHAYTLSVKCLENKLEAAKRNDCDKCKADIEAELAREKEQLKRYKYQYEQESRNG